MKAWDIIGYAYESDYHCVGCTQQRFGLLTEATTDSEGNEVHPIFAIDEIASSGAYCGDCGYEIAEPFEPEEESRD